MKGKVLKTFGIFLISVALITTMVACKSSQQSSGKTTNKNTGNDHSPVTFTMFSSDPNPTWNNMNDEVGKAITKKTGVKLKASFAVGGNPQQKVALIASSGDYPDLIMPKGSITKMVQAGAMVNLAPLINKYAPHIKKLIGPYMNRLRYSNTDHSIYVIPTLNTVGNTYFDAGGGFELQNAVVMSEGYPKIKTLKDFENAIKTYKKKHPTINGKPTIGLSLEGSDWRFLITVTNNAFFTTGAPDDGEFYINPKTDEATFHYLRPVERKYFKWLNHMNAIGLLDPESFTQTFQQYQAKIASGRVIGLTDQEYDIASPENSLKAAGKFKRTYGHYPVTLNASFKRHDFQDRGYGAGWGIGITKDCKDPVRAIKFLDYLASNQGQILNNWGIKGKQYVVKNGKRVIPANVQKQKNNHNTEFTKKTGIGNYNLSVRYGDGVKDPSGNYYTTNFPSSVRQNYSDVTKKVLAHYHAKTWKSLFPSKKEFPVTPWGEAYTINMPSNSNLQVTYQKSEDIVKRYIPKAILAKPSDFNKVYDSMLQKLKATGVDKMDQAYTKLVKQRVKLWSSK